ncbi:MAG: protein kinase [Acidobacteriia bacterium]|nr:protein kinase [Terriglobia bacterium]
MALCSGMRLGPYEVISALGAGGMGEVYRARDTRLDRTVAIKTLPEYFSRSPECRKRFEAEARAISKLNDPHICTLYDVGHQDGIDYLVMEYLEGETLAQRLHRGALPISEALRIGAEIVGALDKAHRQGIVHRDLKPSNIMLTKSGAKLMDFGLAKTVVTASCAIDASASPTLSDVPSPVTAQGAVVGTLQYMSPEQIEGKEADERSDVFAFGSVFFEMLSGKRAFHGNADLSLACAIMAKDPEPLLSVQGTAPPMLFRVLRRCLEKNAENRYQSARDLLLDLEWTASGAAQTETSQVPRSPGRTRWLWASAAAVLLGALALGAAFRLWLRPPSPKSAIRLSIPLPPDQQLTGPPAISPDGQMISYTARTGSGRARLYLRALDQAAAKLISGSEDAALPFFSPDGQWVAFFARGFLLKAAISDGSITRISEAPDPWGGTWGKDGSIVYTSSFNSGLVRASASGGNPEVLTTPDGAASGYGHMYPQFLPDGRHVVFAVWSPSPSLGGIAVLSLDSRKWQLVLPNWIEGVYTSSGHLVVGNGGAGLRVAPFDANHPGPTTVQRSVLKQDIAFVHDLARSWFAISETGTLVYAPADVTKATLVWVDRNGQIQPLSSQQDDYWQPTLSPDSSKLVVRIGGDLWVYDVRRFTRNRLTFSGYNYSAVWTRDGSRILYSSSRGGDIDIYSQLPVATEPIGTLLKRESVQSACSVAPNGTLAFVDVQLATGRDIWTLAPDGKASPLLVTAFNETQCRFSPDGRFIAYVSDESGRREVYVQSYPGPGQKIGISTDGGSNPVWSPDGKGLFFREGEAMMMVELETTPVLTASRARHLFASNDLGFRPDFDVSPDGNRFLMVHRDPGSWPTRIDVVLNWFDEFSRSAPTERD